MAWPRRVSAPVAIVLGCVLASGFCCGGSDADDDGTTGGSSSSGPDDAGDPSGPDPDDSEGEGGCIPGQDDCACLEGSSCIGTSQCIDGSCKPPADIDVPDGASVIAGMRVFVEAEVVADSVSWSQLDGPTVDLANTEQSEVQVDVPPDVSAGEIVTLRLTAVRNTIETTADVPITILPLEVVDALPMITDTEQLGTTEGIDLDDDNLWVVSTEGFVSRFGVEGAFVERYELGGNPIGAHLGQIPSDDDDPLRVLYVANAGTSSIQALEVLTGEIRTITDATSESGPLGTVNFVLPRNNGDLFFTNREGGQVFRYDFDEGTTTLLVEGLGTNPNALAFGPEDDAVLYVGTTGHVHRVALNGEPTSSIYVEFGTEDDYTFEVDGLAFDEAGNLWIGCPNRSTLYLARYAAEGTTEVVRTFADGPAELSGYVSMQFGEGGFGRTSLFWTNLSNRRVARLETGLPAL